MFGNWLNGIPKDYKPLVLVGAAALCWFVWRYRNAVVFDNKKTFFLAGYLRDYTLATNMGYPTTALFAGHPCGGVAFFGPGGQAFFLPGCMGGSLVLGLTAINVLGFYQKLFCRVVCH